MKQPEQNKTRWSNCRIGITGANGSLGRALTKKLREKGALIVGFTHRPIPTENPSNEGPHEWIQWECGEEAALDKTLSKIDILILNHGVNPQGSSSKKDLNNALEVNALSIWRLMERFEKLFLNKKQIETKKELWVNTSEAEIQPALSPAYEISKRLIGQLVSLRRINLNKKQKQSFAIRKLVLGPFRSELNPLGIMNANWVASQIIKQAELNLNLIIVTPNPITFVAMPLTELFRTIYARLLTRSS